MIVLSILISISYCVFFIWLAEGLRKSSKLKIPHIDQLPSVSIIIAARNEEENIPKLLNALSKLTYQLRLIGLQKNGHYKNQLKRLKMILFYKQTLTAILILNGFIIWYRNLTTQQLAS